MIRNNIEQNNGYLFMSEIEDFGISRTYILRYVKDNELERVAKGIYITGETWPDILYIYCIRNPKIIYSGETALYLHSLIDREYSDICVSVPSGYNGSRLREKGVIVHQERDGIYGLGMTDCETRFGNTVRLYDRERCICDLIKNRDSYDIQMFQTALKEYMRRKDRDLNKLIKYAEVLKMREEVMKYVEVMV
jgi:hypothetical protein